MIQELDNADGVPLAFRRSSMFPEGNVSFYIIYSNILSVVMTIVCLKVTLKINTSSGYANRVYTLPPSVNFRLS